MQLDEKIVRTLPGNQRVMSECHNTPPDHSMAVPITRLPRMSQRTRQPTRPLTTRPIRTCFTIQPSCPARRTTHSDAPNPPDPPDPRDLLDPRDPRDPLDP